MLSHKIQKISKKIVHLLAAGSVLLSSFLPNILNNIPVAKAAPGVPQILNHQGRLLDSSGNLLGGTGTDFCFKFSLFDDSAVGAPDTQLWPAGTPSTMTIVVKNGVYNVGIGDTSAGGDTLDYDFQTNSSVFLNVQVATKVGATCAPGDGAESFENLSPRQQVASSGFAINSKTVGGFTPSQTPTGSQIPVLTSGALVIAGSIDTQGTIQAGSSNINITTSTGALDADALGLITADGSGGTSSGSGLEVDTDRLGLLQGCANNEILKWNDASSIWQCAADSTGGTTNWDAIGDPTGAGSIAFNETAQTLDWDMSSNSALDALKITFNNDVAGANTQRVFSIINNNNAANTVTESLIFIDNAETTASTLTDGILITSSGVNNGIVDAIDVSDSNITNALNIGTNNIVTGATTIASTELDLLDGHDAALVDTNDAVATAITGTGALNSGSITSGFGTIDTGADNITTTGTVFGNN